MSGDKNTKKLIQFLDEFSGEDISDKKLELIQYLINTSESDIENCFSILKNINISSENNKDIYNLIRDLVEYHGFENNNFNTLYNFLKNKSTLGLKLSDIPHEKCFSLIDVATKCFSGNKDLATTLMNMVGQGSRINRGRGEVLLSILFNNGYLPNQRKNNYASGDLIIDGVNIEMKCAKGISDKFNESYFYHNCGRIGQSADVFGFKDISGVLHGLEEMFGPHKFTFYNNKTNNNINNIVIKHSENNLEKIIASYKKVFYNFFYGDVLSFASHWIDLFVDYFIKDRSLDDILYENCIMSSKNYNQFRKAIGCLYLCLYHMQKQFDGLFVSSLTSNEEKSMFLSKNLLEKDPMGIYNDLKDNQHIEFCWPRLDKSASHCVVMGVFVL